MISERTKARQLYKQGWTGEKIAKKLGISLRLVDSYLTAPLEIRKDRDSLGGMNYDGQFGYQRRRHGGAQ